MYILGQNYLKSAVMIQLDTNLIKKYNRQGPRYTSYPTAIEFAPIEHISAINYLKEELKTPKELSLYVHLPFCQSLCWYCGCTTVISKNPDVSGPYVDSLIREINATAAMVHPQSTVYQLHFGGGTPTFLREKELIELTLAIKQAFNFSPDAEISIEIDPRTVSKSQIFALAEVGFNRASLGIQDTNIDVQKAIHRVQTFDQNVHAVEWLREAGFTSINIDLIYGLPKQTPTLFKNTLEVVEFLDPDRIALYSYAHIPWIKPAQKLIKDEDLPEPASKIKMMQMALEYLQEKGWDYIGMDHFAKPEDELAIASKNGTLHRNFQGYATKSGLDMLAFGMSGISQVGNVYLQRNRIVQSWSKGVQDLGTTFEKGYFLTHDDAIRKEVIMKIMCSGDVNFEKLNNRFQIDSKQYFATELNELKPFIKDELVLLSEDGFKVTEKGRLFVRNISMLFDLYLRQKEQELVYSKTI
ncbi:oxygen-independent coproporphyrinogen III oxidase [bacterium]|nr:MAG: oxygen-independent coproporphyrinogen III oxidase [bacterium]